MASKAAERYADGDLSEAGLRHAWSVIGGSRFHDDELSWDERLVRHLTLPGLGVRDITAITHAARGFVSRTANDRAAVRAAPAGREVQVARAMWQRGQVAEAEERTAQVDRLRCIFGRPLLPPFTPAALTRNDGAAVKLATVIYEERSLPSGLLDPVRLAILADALEEAGVDDAAALAHLRGPGPHCRGCRVVDAVFVRS